MAKTYSLFGYEFEVRSGGDEFRAWQTHTPKSVHHSEESQDAAAAIHEKAPSLRDKVYELLRHEALTDEMIAARLDMNPNTARPRRIELHNMGLIEQVGTALTVSKRTAALWRATKADS